MNNHRTIVPAFLLPGIAFACATCLPAGLLLALFIGSSAVHAQEANDSAESDNLPLDKMVVSATRSQSSRLDVPYATVVLDEQAVRFQKQARTLPEALSEIPGIMIQKTAHGQGSPYIRGFTGFRTLMLVDGIRLNNSTYRDGPNQYWNTIDPLTIGRLEVVMGPGSVLYGSDAVGGTASVFTRSAFDISPDQSAGASVYYRYADAENANVIRPEVTGFVGENIGVIAGVSIKDFGDLVAGDDLGTQRKTGYDETDIDLKTEFRVDNDTTLVFGFQSVDQNDLWRTHRTVFSESWEGTTIGNELRRDLDQERQLAYLQFHADRGPVWASGWMDSYRLSLSSQDQEEDRFRIRNDGRFDRQGVDVTTTGVWGQFDKDSDIGHWTYGFEYYHDDVDSYRRDYNADGTLNAIRIQGPVADDAEYDLFGFYVQNQWPVNESFSLTGGLRYTYADADAGKVADPATGMQISVSDYWDDVVGSVRASWQPGSNPGLKFYGGVSQGFRAPNLSDLTRLDSARSNEIETPVTGLDSEDFVSYEAGVRWNDEKTSAELVYYYTDIDDMVVRRPTGLIVDGDNEVTKANAGDGHTDGVELFFARRLSDALLLSGSYSWFDGKVDSFPSSLPVTVSEPIDRLMPSTATAAFRWDAPWHNGWVEAVVDWADDADDLSSRDASDTQRIPPGGTPGYTLVHVRSNWSLNAQWRLSLAVENLFDEDYRVHGSGLNGPGTNVVLSVNWASDR